MLKPPPNLGAVFALPNSTTQTLRWAGASPLHWPGTVANTPQSTFVPLVGGLSQCMDVG